MNIIYETISITREIALRKINDCHCIYHAASFKIFGLIVDVAFYETALDQDPLTS